MTHTTLAETILRDVKLYEPDWTKEPYDRSEMVESTVGDWLSRDEVLAALTAAMDPATVERAGELARSDDPKVMLYHGEYVEALRSLLAQNAALRAERDELEHDRNEWRQRANDRGEETEQWFRKYGAEQSRAEAAEAKAEKLRGGIDKLEAALIKAVGQRKHPAWGVIREVRALIEEVPRDG